MNFLNNKYLKIFLLLGAAFLISDFSIKNVFLAKSPKINLSFVQNMMVRYITQPANQTSVSVQNINSLPQDVVEALNAPLKKVSQGVYAGEMNNIKVYEIRTGELEYLEYTFNVNGKEVKIKVPKGQEPPSQEVMDSLYK